MHRHRPLLRLDDNHHLRPCRQPIGHLFRDFPVAVPRRNHLHHQIGRSRPIARHRADRIQPRLTHKSRIRCPPPCPGPTPAGTPFPPHRPLPNHELPRVEPSAKQRSSQFFRVHCPQASSCAPPRALVRSETIVRQPFQVRRRGNMFDNCHGYRPRPLQLQMRNTIRNIPAAFYRHNLKWRASP